MSIKVTFLGGAGCVTGSKYLIEYSNYKILVDCGLFQGQRKWREKNWDTPDVDLREVNAVLLTHAHIDHSGLIPRYVNLGLKCPVYATSATIALANILLPDVGQIQEQDASFLTQKKASKHYPAKPLYTEKDALHALKMFKKVKFNKIVKLRKDISAVYTPMGHILGASAITLNIGDKKLVFSGDIGRYDIPILVDPKSIPLGDYFFIESTYGNRTHPESSVKEELAKVINKTVNRGGVVMIPSFAVGRSQLILYFIRELKSEKIIPDVPVILDSPLASDATDIYFEHPDNYDSEANAVLHSGEHPFEPSKLVFTRAQSSSKKLNDIDEPMIVIAGSGMLNGGRILHHIYRRISDARNTLLFVGYQPPGGKGAYLQGNPATVNIFRQELLVKADIHTISGLSAHADKEEILHWCSDSIKLSDGLPRKVFIVHGEDEARVAFSETLTDEFGFECILPEYLESFEIR